MANTLGFMSHTVSVAGFQLCHCNAKAAIDSVGKWASLAVFLLTEFTKIGGRPEFAYPCLRFMSETIY